MATQNLWLKRQGVGNFFGKIRSATKLHSGTKTLDQLKITIELENVQGSANLIDFYLSIDPSWPKQAYEKSIEQLETIIPKDSFSIDDAIKYPYKLKGVKVKIFSDGVGKIDDFNSCDQ